MNKTVMILKENLTMPIVATELRLEEIRKELKPDSTKVHLNGLFLMLVSYVESMQKEIIKYYLKYQPEKINGDYIEVDKSIFVANEDFYLLEQVVGNYIDKMPYWKLSKIFYELLGIQKPINENKIQVIKNRRNELIHKNLKVDFKRKDFRQDSVSALYLETCIDEYENYLLDIKIKISEAFVKYDKLNLLENLWHYTFKTPLCSNFSDYWHIDIENDIISGCKYPKIENSLSSSEKFMLEIWRSQVCGCKVDFPNMSSIDNHFQNCLYRFLKLSNDLFFYS